MSPLLPSLMPRAWKLRRGASILLAVLACLLAVAASAREVPFDSERVAGYMPILGVPDVQLADIDRDGRTDILACDLLGNQIDWFENDGAAIPSFTRHNIITQWNGTDAPDGPVSLFAADLDRDGDLDVLSASQDDGKIAWYPNTGPPTYSFLIASTTRIGTVPGARAVFAADLDSDGDQDVLSASSGDDRIAWYESNGAATPGFTMRTISTAADGATSVYAADLDGDGDRDVLSASTNDDKIAWYENDGASPPGFTARTISTAADGAVSVSAADVDRDGDQDVVSASPNSSTIIWYENDGARPPSFTTHIASSTASPASEVCPFDLDADGDVDIPAQTDGVLSWYENLGGSLPAFTGYLLGGYVLMAGVAVGDLNHDGQPELVSGASVPDVILWLRNLMIHRSAVFPDREPITTAGNFPFSVVSVDVDGDGDLDALYASSSGHAAVWAENVSGDGSSWVTRTIGTSSYAIRQVRAGDMDGDGDLDVIAGLVGENKLVWYENSGGAGLVWVSHLISSSATGPQTAFAADIDRDGDLDAVYGSIDGHKIVWFENTNGTGTAWFARTIATGNLGLFTGSLFVEWVIPGDVDRDGDLDVVAASQGGDRVAWYENAAGNGTAWTAHIIDNSARIPVSVAIGDADGDGDVDVFSSATSGLPVVLHENTNGSGTAWSSHVLTTDAPYALMVHAADLDGDGDLDALSASQGDDKIAWYENTAGDGSAWTTREITRGADGATSVWAGDVDGDGDVDVLTASGVDDHVDWFPNRGGQFAAPAQPAPRAAMLQGATNDVLRVVATHRGRSGDSDIEVTGLSFRFEESPGDPLTSAEANALIENLTLYRDTGSGQFEAGSDTLVATVGSLALTSGVQTFSFSDGDPNVRVAQGAPATFFLVAQITANGAGQIPRIFRVTHLTDSAAAEDAPHDLPLTVEGAPNSPPAKILVTTPTGDADGDGLLDIYETGTGVYVSPTDTGSDPLIADTDGDGIGDGHEVHSGTDPNDPNSHPVVPTLGALGAGLLVLGFLLAGRRVLMRR